MSEMPSYTARVLSKHKNSSKELFYLYHKYELTEKEEKIVAELERIKELMRQKDELIKKLEQKLYWNFIVARKEND